MDSFIQLLGITRTQIPEPKANAKLETELNGFDKIKAKTQKSEQVLTV